VLRSIIAFIVLLLPVAAQAQGNYAIQPGDVLAVEVAEDNQLSRQVLVLPDGRISFPFAGTVRAAGMTTSQVERALSSAMADDFAAPPTVYVSVARINPAEETDGDTINVYLMGEVMAPGLKEVKPGTTLLQALSQAGGFSKFAATKRVQLRRADPQGGREHVYRYNYKALTRGAALPGSVVLREGDVILVPERGLFE
jgi:polysaccharide export outer membrane protein